VNRSGESEEGEDPKQDTNKDSLHGEGEKGGMGGSEFGIGNDNDNEEKNGDEYENMSVIGSGEGEGGEDPEACSDPETPGNPEVG